MEVDDKIQTHDLFRDLICGNNAYGAERWVLALERMCERIASASSETIPSCESGGGWLHSVFFDPNPTFSFLICDLLLFVHMPFVFLSD